MKERILRLLKEKKYVELRRDLEKIDASSLADLLMSLQILDFVTIFRLLPKDASLKVFFELDFASATMLLTALSSREAVDLMDDIHLINATKVLDEIDPQKVNSMLKNCSKNTRSNINHLLNYGDDTAGAIMNVRYSVVKNSDSLDEASKILKANIKLYESLNICYVVDDHGVLVGDLKLSDLLFKTEATTIDEVCNKKILSVKTITNQDDVADLFKRFDITVVPVVDLEGRLVGVITIDNILNILENAATDDIKRMAAIIPGSKSYDKMSAFELFKARIPWLLLLMVSATFTGKIIQSFEAQLASYTILTAFIPMLMDTGGNAGGQSSVSVIRALSLNNISFKDFFKVTFKEFRVAILCSIVLAICNFIKMLIIDRVTVLVALTVCATLVVTVIFAKILGAILPMIVKRIGLDPAVMVSPFITTIVDALSLLVYFNFATFILGL